MKNLETEEKEYLSDKLEKWKYNHKIMIRLIVFTLYIIFVISLAIILVNLNGGMQSTLHVLNDYPEQEYKQLEQELQNIIVEKDGIYPDKLSKDDIRYDISYHEYNNFEGEYNIELTDSVTVTATIGKDLKKESLEIKREEETENEYRRSQWSSAIIGILVLSLIPILILILIIIVCMFILVVIEGFIKLYNKNKAKKKN